MLSLVIKLSNIDNHPGNVNIDFRRFAIASLLMDYFQLLLPNGLCKLLRQAENLGSSGNRGSMGAG